MWVSEPGLYRLFLLEHLEACHECAGETVMRGVFSSRELAIDAARTDWPCASSHPHELTKTIRRWRDEGPIAVAETTQGEPTDDAARCAWRTVHVTEDGLTRCCIITELEVDLLLPGA